MKEEEVTKPEREWWVVLVEQYTSCWKLRQCHRQEAAAQSRSVLSAAAAAAAVAVAVAVAVVTGGDGEASAWRNRRPPPL